MKFLSLIFIIGLGAYFLNQAGPWSKDRKNSEIADAIKKYGPEMIRDLKSDELIADANIKHDKKQCGMIFYIKMVKIPQRLSNRELRQMRTSIDIELHRLIRQKNDPEIRELRGAIKEGIYLMYRYYLNNGKVFASVKLTKNNI